MKLKVVFLFFHTLLVLSSAGKVKEDSDDSNSEQSLRKQKSKYTILEGSIGQINEQVTQNSNRYKEMAEFVQEQQKLLRTVSDSIALFHGEFSNVGRRLTPLENMHPNVTGTPDSTSPRALTSHCGGRLLGESGVISYKEDEMYNNEENCTWIIEVPEAVKIGFKLEKTGLQGCCDHVFVTSLDTGGLVQQWPVALNSYRIVFVDGPKAIVTFYSDEFQIGVGFRLSYYKITDLNDEIIYKSECGGVIVGKTGVISYKFEELYSDNERCVWLVHSPNSTSITFHLRDAGFEKGSDYVSVTTIDPEIGTFRNDTLLLINKDDTITVQGSIAAVVFISDSMFRWTGFFLTFSGNGVNTNHKYVYKLRHIAEPNATIEYPGSDRNDDEITKQQHIYVTATNIEVNREWSQSYISGIELTEGIFLRANDSSCVYDSLTFYEPIPQDLGQIHDEIQSHYWQKKGQIPNENDTLLCPEEISVPKQMGLLEFGAHSFLAIYKPISKDTLESSAAVSFDYYYKPNKCVEIVQPLENEFGIISYKEKGSYSNEKNCGWMIEVTNATRIDFNLEQNGFEDCDFEVCDYVAVTSLDMDDQIQGTTLKLRAGSTTASVTGSRALVIFMSGIDNVESEFRLRYESGVSLEENACGEVLNPMLDDFGVISYKANENYANCENCQWRIEAPAWGKIGFNLEQSGFEMYHDFVTISSVNSNGTEIGQPIRLDYDNRNASLAGPTALVRFTSDEYEYSTGTGFRLRYDKLPAIGH